MSVASVECATRKTLFSFKQSAPKQAIKTYKQKRLCEADTLNSVAIAEYSNSLTILELII